MLSVCCCGFQRAEGHWCVCVHPDGSLSVHVSYFEGDYQQWALKLKKYIF